MIWMVSMYRFNNIFVDECFGIAGTDRGIAFKSFSKVLEDSKIENYWIEYADDKCELRRCRILDFIQVFRTNDFVGKSQDRRGYYVSVYTDIATMAHEYLHFSRVVRLENLPSELYDRLILNQDLSRKGFVIDTKYEDDFMSIGKSYSFSDMTYIPSFYIRSDYESMKSGNIVDYILNNKDKVVWDTSNNEVMIVRSVPRGKTFSVYRTESAVCVYKYDDKFLKYLLV